MKKRFLSSERSIGYTQNLYRARETVTNQVNVLVLGAIGGCSSEMFTLLMALSFVLGLFADIPTGILADNIKHSKTFILGMFCVAIAPILLLLSILSEFPDQVVIFIVVVNAILLSGGNSILSGAYEAYIFGMLERLQPDYVRSAFKLIGTSQLQKFGAYLLLLIPSMTITVALILERLYSLGYLNLCVLPIISLWLLWYAIIPEKSPNLDSKKV
ncbi:hypothetical protein V3564_06200 [Bartonella sp. B12(2025)]